MLRQSIPTVTKNLLIINGLFFLATYIFETKGIDLTVILGAFYPESPNFKGWQIITHMFMHGSFEHILFNMISLWMFGSAVENTIGSKKFLNLFILAGFGAFILFNLVNYIEISQLQKIIQSEGISIAQIYKESELTYFLKESNGEIYRVFKNPISNLTSTNVDAETLFKDYITPMVGASGAIYGLLIGFAVLYPDSKIAIIFFPVGIKAKYLIPVLIVIELFMGIKNYEWNNVAHFAHLGGALIGFLYVRNWKKNLYRKN